jgi:ABC-type transporter Mla subunit MlaD
MKNHDKLKQAAADAIEALIGDDSVPLNTTYEDLQEIVDDLEVRLEMLRHDIKKTGG